jgi:OOP family OmpA-OmpF porin
MGGDDVNKGNIIRKLTLSLALSFCVTASAAELDERWHIDPALSYIKADSDRNSRSGAGIRLGAGKAISQSWDMEANLVADKLNGKSGSASYKQTGIGLDALYYFTRDANFSPYGVLGLGVLNTKRIGENANAMANAGVGFKKALNADGLALRADLRYRLDFDDHQVAGQDRFGDWLLNVGLSIPLGEKTGPAPVAAALAPAVAAKPADSDGDGVIDSEDRCPDTPAGAKVDARGCELDSDGDGVVDGKDKCPDTPAGAKVDARGCELDSDGDGVTDSRDQCPETPAGAKVDARGCEPDDDGDGVADSKDKCPDTHKGAKVDTNGCEIAEVIVLKGVNFETASNRLTQDSIGILDKVADTLIARPHIAIEVAGYTDSRGSAAYNRTLSRKRAQAVADYLIKRGVKAENLTAKGYGEENPVADNKTAEGQAENRRVELHILTK